MPRRNIPLLAIYRIMKIRLMWPVFTKATPFASTPTRAAMHTGASPHSLLYDRRNLQLVPQAPLGFW